MCPMARDLSMVEFDQWIICPKCMTAMVGVVDEECFMCHVPMVATPLYPDCPVDLDTESSKIVARVQHARATQARETPEALCAEFGVEYTPDEQEILDEFGL